MKKTIVFLALACLLFSGTTAQAQSPAECLTMVRKMETALPTIIDSARASIKKLIPDPVAYEKSLPSRDLVVQTKDKNNLKNYGGLSEAYLFGDQPEKAEQLHSWFLDTARTVLDPGETFVPAVTGDFGIYYFEKQDYKRAEPLFLKSINDFESHLSPAVYNNLISDYLCMSLIRDRQGNKEEAGSYAKKLVELSIKQHEESSPEAATTAAPTAAAAASAAAKPAAPEPAAPEPAPKKE